MTITDFFIRGDMTIEEIAKLFEATVNDVAFWYNTFDYALASDEVSEESFEALCEKIDMRFKFIDL